MKSHVTRYLRDGEISSRAATVNFVCRFCRLLQYSQVEKPVQIADWDLQEFLNMSLKFLPILSYVCNVLYVTSLMWGGLHPDIILVVYSLLLCEQFATDNKYFIFLRLLLNNIGKCHSFLRLNRRHISSFTLSQSFHVKAEGYFLHRSEDIMKKVVDYSFQVAAVLWLTLFTGIIPYIHNGFWKLEQASANKWNINEIQGCII